MPSTGPEAIPTPNTRLPLCRLSRESSASSSFKRRSFAFRRAWGYAAIVSEHSTEVRAHNFTEVVNSFTYAPSLTRSLTSFPTSSLSRFLHSTTQHTEQSKEVPHPDIHIHPPTLADSVRFSRSKRNLPSNALSAASCAFSVPTIFLEWKSLIFA